MFNGDVKFAVDQSNKKLIGTQVVGTILTPDEEAWGLQVRTQDGNELLVWVDCDPEGNGPGWLQIEEKPS